MPAQAALPQQHLTLRQREILRSLVQEYIASGNPVGSGTIQRIRRLGVSSATIRNELSILEERGYLGQPHTSAGRVPTVRGYRYFVQHLMERVELPASEQRTIRHQFYQIGLDLDQWLRLSAAVLARTAQSASLVTAPHAVSSQFRHLEMVSISEAAVLMILVLQDGTTYQEVLLTPDQVEQDRLKEISNRLNYWLHGRQAGEIRASLSPELTTLSGWEAGLLPRIRQLMEQSDRRSVRDVYSDGLANVLRHPEFLQADRLRQIIDVLEHVSLLEPILLRMLDTNGVQIIIGGEGHYEAIEHVSLVLSRYGVKQKASGVLGIMGPIRMPYARTISAVGYVAQIVGGLVADVYGSHA